jgi:hypothetical protein
MSTLERLYFVVVHSETGRCLERIYSSGAISDVPCLYETARTAARALSARHPDETNNWRVVPVRLLHNVLQ